MGSDSHKDSISGYAPVNGLKMYYEIHGKGDTIVLIHGGGSTIGTTFGNILPLLASHYSVVAVELQAHGHTNDRNSPESFEQDADDVAALLHFLKMEKAHIFGFSNGGSTALQIAIRHPELVKKVIAVSAIYKREGMFPGFFDMMQNASLENMPAPLKKAYMDITGSTEGLQIMHDRDKATMIGFKDWTDESLRSIKAQTLVINADKDVVTNAHAIKIAQLIPTASLLILPGVHGSIIGEICTTTPGSKMPAITVAAIEEFLDKK